MVRQRHSKIQITKILAKGGKIIDEAKIIEKKKTVKVEKSFKRKQNNRITHGNKESRWIFKKRPR